MKSASWHCLAIWAGLLFLDSPGEELRVATPEELSRAVAQARAGDEVVIADGNWHDVTLLLAGHGAAGAPIRIRPKTPGGLKITGASRIRIGGTHLEISGLHCLDFCEASDFLEFRENSKKLASDCRVTDCVFEQTETFDPRVAESRWINIYGERNSFDHCHLAGKKNQGATLVVWLRDNLAARHHLHHNHFAHRPELGENGGETIRVGDSKTSHLDADCLIERNLFERCNGEAECVSNKSCQNRYRDNLFREVEGALTLRHGDRCRVEGNVFLGGGRNKTGGIRVIGAGHTIVGNYLADLRGVGGRGTLVLQNGIRDSPANGYAPVVGVTLEDNEVISCRESLVIGYADRDAKESTVPPTGCVIRGNRLFADSGDSVIVEHNSSRGTTWENNLAAGGQLGIDEVPGLRFLSESETRPYRREPPRQDFLNDVGPSWKRAADRPATRPSIP